MVSGVWMVSVLFGKGGKLPSKGNIKSQSYSFITDVFFIRFECLSKILEAILIFFGGKSPMRERGLGG